MKINSMVRNGILIAVGLAAGAAVAPSAFANQPYFNGFETPGSTQDFSGPVITDPSTGAYSIQPGADITRVASGGGTLGLTAASGGYYAEITNVHNTYLPTDKTYGQATAAYFGGAQQSYTGNFTESVDMYVNVAGWAASPGATQGFQLDASPSNSITGDAAYNTYNAQGAKTNQGDETQFYVAAPTVNNTPEVTIGGAIDVLPSASNSDFATITQSGWYNFAVSFDKGSGGYVQNTFTVSTLGGTVLGSFTGTSPMPASQLGGNNYGLWFEGWYNGFAGDTIGIDNVTVTPEPASVALIGVGLAAGCLLLRRRRAQI